MFLINPENRLVIRGRYTTLYLIPYYLPLLPYTLYLIPIGLIPYTLLSTLLLYDLYTLYGVYSYPPLY